MLPKIGFIEAGKNKTRVGVYYVKIFNVLFISLLGGRSHIGAVSAAIRPRSKVFAKTLRVPGHQDDVITRRAISLLSKKYKGPVIAVAGIHYDGITGKQIRDIIKNSDFLCRNVARKLRC